MIRSRQEDYQTVIFTIVFAVAIILFAMLLVRLAVVVTEPSTTTSSIGSSYTIDTRTLNMSDDVVIQKILSGEMTNNLPESWQNFESSLNWMDYAGYHIPPIMPAEKNLQLNPF